MKVNKDVENEQFTVVASVEYFTRQQPNSSSFQVHLEYSPREITFRDTKIILRNM